MLPVCCPDGPPRLQAASPVCGPDVNAWSRARLAFRGRSSCNWTPPRRSSRSHLRRASMRCGGAASAPARCVQIVACRAAWCGDSAVVSMSAARSAEPAEPPGIPQCGPHATCGVVGSARSTLTWRIRSAAPACCPMPDRDASRQDHREISSRRRPQQRHRAIRVPLEGLVQLEGGLGDERAPSRPVLDSSTGLPCGGLANPERALAPDDHVLHLTRQARAGGNYNGYEIFSFGPECAIPRPEPRTCHCSVVEPRNRAGLIVPSSRSARARPMQSGASSGWTEGPGHETAAGDVITERDTYAVCS